jgi:hypothetical protein
MKTVDEILLQYRAELRQGLNELAGHDPLKTAKSQLLEAVLEVINKQTFQMLLQLHNHEHLNGGYIKAVDLIDEIKELFGVKE